MQNTKELNMKKIVILCLLSLSLWSTALTNVYSVTYKGSIDTIEENILEHFKEVKLVVPWKLDILNEFKRKGLEKKFGKNFNTSHLSSVRTIVACNGKFGNMIINADPTMMAFCPIRITLIEKDGKTTVLYVRPTSAPKDSKAYPILKKLEKKVIKAIEDANDFENKS